MTRMQITDFLFEHQQDPLYAGVDGFVPRRVENFSVATIRGHFCNVGDFIVLENPSLHAIGSISFSEGCQCGFSVKSIESYKDGYRLVLA